MRLDPRSWARILGDTHCQNAALWGHYKTKKIAKTLISLTFFSLQLILSDFPLTTFKNIHQCSSYSQKQPQSPKSGGFFATCCHRRTTTYGGRNSKSAQKNLKSSKNILLTPLSSNLSLFFFQKNKIQA